MSLTEMSYTSDRTVSSQSISSATLPRMHSPAEQQQNSYPLGRPLTFDRDYEHRADLRMREDFSHMLHDTEFYDAEILVEVHGSLNREIFLVHKAILAARSPAFRRMFRSQPLPKPRLSFTDTALIFMQAIIQFIYTDDVDLDHWERADVQELFKMSVKFGIPGLQELCEVRLANELHPTSAFQLLEFAVDFRAPKLLHEASRFINQDVTDGQSFGLDIPRPLRTDIAVLLWREALAQRDN